MACRFNEFGDDSRPAAKKWAPKLVVIYKFLTSKFGKWRLNIDVRICFFFFPFFYRYFVKVG